MKLSYTHPAASNGLPVFLDDKGEVMGGFDPEAETIILAPAMQGGVR